MASAEIEYRCFVGGLTWATESIINDRETGRSRGFRFVTFSSEEAMRAAIAGMDGQDLDGRNITVNEAQSRGRGGEYRSGGGYNRGGGDFRVVDNTCEDNISEIGRNSLHWQFTPFQKLNFTVEHVDTFVSCMHFSGISCRLEHKTIHVHVHSLLYIIDIVMCVLSEFQELLWRSTLFLDSN